LVVAVPAYELEIRGGSFSNRADSFSAALRAATPMDAFDLLKAAPIVILDEATSALDTESELAIQRAFNELVRGRTVLAVAHRLSTIASFDRVIVLVDGRIVEDGNPAELRRRRDVFDQMWRMQAEGFEIDDLEPTWCDRSAKATSCSTMTMGSLPDNASVRRSTTG
jgi:ABC-type multidrug transport system ATPase subunit